MRDEVIAWDSCVILDAIQKTPGRWDAIAPMVNAGQAGELHIIVSAMCVAEVYFLRGLAAQGMAQAQQNEVIARWLDSEYLVKRSVDLGVADAAAEICRTVRGALTPPDAIVVATALLHGATALITYDDAKGQSLLKQDQKIPCPDGSMLRICRPQDWNQTNSPQLFDAIDED